MADASWSAKAATKLREHAKTTVRWVSGPLKIVVGLGIPVVLGHASQSVLDEERARTEERHMKEERRQRLRDSLQKDHKDYSLCMFKAGAWHRTYPEPDGPGAAFVAAMAAPVVDPAAAEVNACRSLCKDYWRAGRELARMDVLEEEKQELEARHERFVALFKPLDRLAGYDERDMLVYKPLVPPAPTPAAPGPSTATQVMR